MRVAVTVDDMFLLRGWPHAPGHDPIGVAQAFVRAFEAHGITGVYQFSATARLEDDPGLYRALDLWCEAGHHVGNHTHHHPSFNLVETDVYAREIEISERYIGRYIEAAPSRCFRFCADQWGNTECKCAEIRARLDEMDYRPIPVSVGFDDAHWSSAYRRVVRSGLKEDLAWIRGAYVASAVQELRRAADTARGLFDRDPAQIWLIHGTSIAADAIGDILDRFAEAGVEFISMEAAMADPMNAEVPPRVSPEFIFQVQKWALALGRPADFPRAPELDQIETLHPEAGEMDADMLKRAFASIVAHAGQG